MQAPTTEIMPSIRRRARKSRAIPRGGVSTLPAANRSAPPFALIALAAFVVAAIYVVFFAGLRSGGAAETPALDEQLDAGAPIDAPAEANHAHLGLIGQRRQVSREQADASPAPPRGPTSHRSGGLRPRRPAPEPEPPEPERADLVELVRQLEVERGPLPPPQAVLCELPPNAIVIGMTQTSLDTPVGTFQTYYARHPCDVPLIVHLEHSDQIVINAVHLAEVPACLDLRPTVIEITNDYLFWIFPNGGVFTACNSPRELSTRSREQRTPRQRSSPSSVPPASNTPARGASPSPTRTKSW